jgi:aminopeptidase N
VDTTATLVPDLFGLLNRNSYQKGGLVLHMLRTMLGDSAFFGGVRAYYAAHEHGTALSDDLRFALERASGRDLSWFFDQWVYGRGHPVLRVSHTYDAAARQAVVTIEQVQDAAWPAFRFETEVSVRSGGGIARGTVMVSERTTTLRIPLAAAPTAVSLEPVGWLLHEMAGS